MPNNPRLVDPLAVKVVEDNNEKNGPEMVMVSRGQRADQVLRNIQWNNLGGKQHK